MNRVRVATILGILASPLALAIPLSIATIRKLGRRCTNT